MHTFPITHLISCTNLLDPIDINYSSKLDVAPDQKWMLLQRKVEVSYVLEIIRSMWFFVDIAKYRKLDKFLSFFWKVNWHLLPYSSRLPIVSRVLPFEAVLIYLNFRHHFLIIANLLVERMDLTCSQSCLIFPADGNLEQSNPTYRHRYWFACLQQSDKWSILEGLSVA